MAAKKMSNPKKKAVPTKAIGKKELPKTGPRAKPPAKAKPQEAAKRYYVSQLALDAMIRTTSNSTPATEVAGFEQAKEQAVDRLIDLIDDAERRLFQLKRATNYDEFVQLSSDH